MVASRPETEWDDWQRGWMLALFEYRASRCPGCGQNVAESMAPEGAHVWRAQSRRCWACDAKATAMDAAPHGEHDRPVARYWTVRKVR